MTHRISRSRLAGAAFVLVVALPRVTAAGDTMSHELSSACAETRGAAPSQRQ